MNPINPPPPPPRRRRRWPWVVGGIVVLFLAISAAGAGMSGTNDNPVVRDNAVGTTEAPVQPATDDPTSTTEAKIGLTPEAFLPALTVKSKQCFGEAGCNVTFQIDLTYAGDTADLDGHTFDVTYQVDGGDSGPIIGTISATGSSYDVSENFVSTHSSEAPLTVKVTAVEEYTF